MNLLITGSERYPNKFKIQKFLFELKEKYGTENIYVATRGKSEGVDKYVKNISISFGFKYGEFIPYHQHHTLYCIMPAFRFDKPYNPQFYFWRDNDALKWSDTVILFINNDNEKNKDIEHMIKIVKKSTKKHYIIGE